MCESINKVHKFSKYLQLSTSALSGKGLKEFSHLHCHHCVTGNR